MGGLEGVATPNALYSWDAFGETEHSGPMTRNMSRVDTLFEFDLEQAAVILDINLRKASLLV